MRFCERHWAGLREEITKVGLEQHIRKGGEALATALASGEIKDYPDPLFGAFMDIVQHAVELGGTEVLSQQGCPLCFLAGVHSKTCVGCDLSKDEFAFDYWLGLAARAQREFFDERAKALN